LSLFPVGPEVHRAVESHFGALAIGEESDKGDYLMQTERYNLLIQRSVRSFHFHSGMSPSSLFGATPA